MQNQILEAIEVSQKALRDNPDVHWIIGFSGGKDSTATLKIFLSAVNKVGLGKSRVTLVYCDTGVENPLIDNYVKSLFRNLDTEFARSGMNISTQILKAPVAERFFVKVIGRGYPTPTNSFRWCTKNLRIKPVEKFVSLHSDQTKIVVLGIRRDESEQRRRTIKKSGDSHWQIQNESKAKTQIFAPIVNLDVPDVWDSVFWLNFPRSVQPKLLEKIYFDASGECPIIKSPLAPPCASGRFGCWTCTVVRKDKSATKLIDAGYTQLEPYLAIRNWLSIFRDDKSKRWPERRNGVQLAGPFTISARREILAKVRKLELETGTIIVGEDEFHEIKRLWKLDYEREKSLGLKSQIA